jgi:uncharacterized membrane protein
MVAQMSDGSAPDYVDTSVSNSTGPVTLGVYTFVYKAGVAGSNLIVTYTQVSPTTGNVTIQAATLNGSAVAQDFSVGATPATQTVVAGSTAPYTVNVSSIGGFAGTVGFTVTVLPAGVSAGFSPSTLPGSGSTTMTLTTGSATVPGNYPLTIRAASGSTSHTANVTIGITAPAAGGTLNGSIGVPSNPVQLTAEGSSDWAHWGVTAVTDYNHKAAVSPQISNFALAAGGTVSRYANNGVGFTWTDGTPTSTATNSTTGVFVPGQGNGFRVTAPADKTTRTLRVYVGAWRATARMLAHLSDGSALDYTDTSLTNSAGVTTLGVYTLVYAAASAGQTLSVTFTQSAPTVGGTIGNVTLQAATLAGGVPSPDFSVSATPPSQSAAAGGSAAYTVTTTALNGFNGSIGLSATGLPSGVTAVFNPAMITGSGSGTLTLTAAPGTMPGSYPVTITATAGSLTHTTSVTLNVTGGADFSISATPSSRPATPGSSVGYTVSVTALNGFAGTVSFGVTGLPAGGTATFTPTTVSGTGSTTMTITTPAGATAGNYLLTVAGTNGALSHTANVTLAVSDFTINASPSSRTVGTGGSAAYTISTTALNGFNGTIAFAASGLPAGTTASFSPTTIAGSGSTTMTLATGSGTPAGSYTVTVTGTSGSISRTKIVSLSVTTSSGSGSLTGAMSTPAGTIQLTAQGTADWAHWGLTTTSDFSHKAGVVQQISNFTPIGSNSANRYTNNPVGFTWTDGTPAKSATNTTTGIYVPTLNGGFRITIPADTTLRTLSIYVGAWRAQARMIAHLSDGSAPDYSDGSLTNSAGATTLSVYTFTYNAASSGQTLTISFTLENETIAGVTGNITLQAATLSSGLSAPDFTVSALPASRSVNAGSSAAYTITVSALNGFGGAVGFSASGLPAGVTAGFAPATVTGSGTSTMTLTTTAGVAAGTYPVTITATSGTISHTAGVSLTVAAAGGGALTGSMTAPSGPVQLTTQGTADWAHWGLTTAADYNHKANVTPQISNVAAAAGGTITRYANNGVGFSWTDGAPTISATDSTTGVYVAGQNNGFRITAPADTAVHTLRVYVGAWHTQGRLVAHLSDGSAVDYVDTSLVNSISPTSLGVYTLVYHAASAGQTLSVTFTQTNGNGNVTIQAATLQ